MNISQLSLDKFKELSKQRFVDFTDTVALSFKNDEGKQNFYNDKIKDLLDEKKFKEAKIVINKAQFDILKKYKNKTEPEDENGIPLSKYYANKVFSYGIVTNNKELLNFSVNELGGVFLTSNQVACLIKEKNLNTLKELIENPAIKEVVGLHWIFKTKYNIRNYWAGLNEAIKNQDMESISFLMQKQKEVNVVNDNNEVQAMIPSLIGTAIDVKNLEIVKYLVESNEELFKLPTNGNHRMSTNFDYALSKSIENKTTDISSYLLIQKEKLKPLLKDIKTIADINTSYENGIKSFEPSEDELKVLHDNTFIKAFSNSIFQNNVSNIEKILNIKPNLNYDYNKAMHMNINDTKLMELLLQKQSEYLMNNMTEAEKKESLKI